MPFPTDEAIMQTSRGLVEQLQKLFGKHAGMRPAHAKGVLLKGTFTPSPSAASLSCAPHFLSPSPTPVTVRFSSSTGIPNIPDTNANADPRGIAVRFHLGVDAEGRRRHTDVIGHSTPFFPARTGEDFLAFLQAIEASGGEGVEKPTPVERFLEDHPAARAFVQAPKPPPVSFAREVYYGVNALKMVNEEGRERYVRYRFVPLEGVQTLAAEEVKAMGDNYLSEEIAARLGPGESGAFAFRLLAQVAAEGDVTDDATVHWLEDRALVELGMVRVEALVNGEESGREQKQIIFDPIPRVQGIEPSGDPLLEMRAAVYLVSGLQRRAA